MNRPHLRCCLLAFVLCAAFVLPAPADPTPAPAPVPALPPVVARYEQMLAASPAKGTAFDKVYQHFFEGPGLDALAARWRARAAAGGPGADTFPLLLGLLAERRAHPDEARAAYRQYAEAHPDDPRGWTALGELESSEGRFVPAADAFAHALAPGAKPAVPASSRPALYRELARAQARSFLVAASLGTWRKLAAEFPDDPGVLQEVGEALQEDQAYDEARATFEKVRELARQNNDAFGRINATLRTGQVEEARGHAAEAVKIYEGVVAEAKTGSWLEREARARIEQLYRGQEDLPGLADYYQQWLEDHPKDTEVATRRAAVLIELNRRAEAIDLLKQAVVWAPERQELQVELARRLGEADRPAEMAAVMEKLVAVAPEEKSYWQLLGDARWQLLEGVSATASSADKDKLQAQALAAWDHLSPPDGKDAAATGQLADLLASHHLRDQALAQYARAAALAPDLPDARERWAAYLAQIERKDEARKVVAGIVGGSPKNANAANFTRLAAALDRFDDPDGALAAADQGLRLEERNFDLLALRWQLLTGRKRWAEAAALYPALLAAAPNAYFAEQVQARQVVALQAADQLAATRAVLAGRLGGKNPPPLDENDLALLVRLDLQAASADTDADALAQARQALAEGRARFPRAAVFARLEGELAKRARDVDGQVAALRRLIDLQPAQKSDALAEIARVYRDAGRLDDAVAAAGELVVTSPANAAAHLLLADLLLQGGHADEGVARLEDAVRLSDKPNDVRLRLARVEADLGRDADARRTLDEAFENADDAHERLAITKPLTAAYLRENRLDELITRFQKLQQGESEGWRYALYLAEIYQETKDYGAARRELAKALAARPRDGSLLRQLVRIAEDEQNTAEVARYQTMLAEVEPSDQNRLALVSALLENNQPEAGLRALRTNLPAILKIPGAWDQLLPLLARNDLTGKAGELLTAEMGGDRADVKARFTLALFQAVAGNLDQARAAFWSVFDVRTGPAPLSAAPASPGSSTSPNVGMRMAKIIYGGDSIPEQRYRAGEMTRRTAQMLLYPGGFAGFGRNARGFFGLPSSGSGYPNTPTPTDTSRDAALLYLAALAVKDHTAAEFLAELDRHLAARDSSRADRLVAYSLMGDVDAQTREIAAQVRNLELGLDGLALSRAALIAYNNDPQVYRYSEAPPLTTAQVDALAPLFDPLLARVLHGEPTFESADPAPFRYAFLLGVHQKEKAEAVRHDFLAGISASSSPDNLESALGLLTGGDFSAPDRALLRTVVTSLSAAWAKAGGGGFGIIQYAYIPASIFQDTSGAGKLGADDFADVLASLVPIWYPLASPTAANGVSAGAGSRYRPPGSEDGGLPQTRFFEPNTLQSMHAVGQFLHQGDAARFESLLARLDRQGADLPASSRMYPQLVAVYLQAYAGDPGAALPRAQALLAAAPDDNDLRLLTGVLLGRTDHHAEALALLATVDPARSGETPFNFQMLILAEATAAKDIESAKRAGLRLAAMRVPPEQREPLSARLRELGLTQQAEALAKPALGSVSASSAQSGRRRSIFEADTVQRLEKFNNDKNEDGALALARSVLAALPPPPPGPYGGGSNEEYVLRATISTIKKYGKLDEFVADAEKQLAKDPGALSLNYQLAVLHQESGGLETKETRAPHPHRAPVWVRLTRGEDGAVAGGYSLDGQTWTEIARARVPLGDAPLAALPAASSQKTPVPLVVLDHVTLTPAPTDAAPSPATDNPAGALPQPWVDSQLSTGDLPADAAPPAPVAVHDGAWTLPTRGWNLWGTYDDGRLVHRPLGAATELAAQVVSLEGGADETKAGVMFRASLEPDSPYAAVIALPGGGLSFQHRDEADQATDFWRKLVALRPKETRYQRLLAHRLAERGLRDEAMNVFNHVIDQDPEEAFSEYNDLQFIYRGARIIPLAERLLAWKPGGGGPAPGARIVRGYSFYQVANECATQKRPDLVIALCRHGLEADATVGAQTPDLSKLLVTTLLEAGRRDEARDALLANLLPPGDAAKTGGAGNAALQLGFRNPAAARYNRNTWMSTLSWNVDSVELYGLQPLESARSAGLLPDVAAALVARQKSDPAAFANDDLTWLLTIVRLDLHDPALLDELPAMLDAKPRGNGSLSRYVNEQAEVAVRQTIAKRLLQWPGHESLALEAFRASQRTLADARRSNNTFSSNLLSAIDFQQARAELLLDDPRSAVATLHALAGELVGPGATNNGNVTEEIRRCLALFLRAGAEADAGFLDLYNQAIKNPDNRKALNFTYDLERDVRVGDTPRFQALAWLLDDGAAAGPDATLVYELRPEHPFDKSGLGRFPGSRARSFPGSEGPRTLTFAYGADPAHFAPIGQLQTTRTFGTWTGPIPPGSGLLKVTIDTPRPQEVAALAAATPPAAPAADYWLRVVRTPNLWANPDFEGLPNRDPNAATFTLPGWKDLPAGLWKQGTGDNPHPGHPFVQSDTSNRQTYTLIGTRIPREAGQAYFQSGWVRDGGDNNAVRVGRRYLDADGKVLKTSVCPEFSTLVWRWHSQRLAPEVSAKEDDAIPARTAFIEPFLRVQGSNEWTGLFLGKAE